MLAAAADPGVPQLSRARTLADLESGALPRGEACDKLLQLIDLLCFIPIFGFNALPGGHLLLHHVVVVARVEDDSIVIDVRDMSTHCVQKVPVV